MDDSVEVPSTSRHPGGREFGMLIVLMPIALVFVVLISMFYVANTTAYIDGDSMEPTLHNGELVLVSRDVDDLIRGDVVVVALSTANNPETHGLVKRIVGLPGDEIYVEMGNAFVNGSPERGDHTVYVADADISFPRTVVPDGSLFLLGDNRPISEDSRLFGMVPLDSVTGRVTLVLTPLGSSRIVD